MEFKSTTMTQVQALASPGQRFVAALIDGLLIMAVAFIPFVGWAAGMLYGLTKDALPFLEGQSIGKKAMKIKVLKDPDGTDIIGDYGTSIIRVIPGYIPIFNLVDALMVFSSDRKRFGDKWAKTKVVVL
jgi:uncharacterized RDD family membrane protein YckC